MYYCFEGGGGGLNQNESRPLQLLQKKLLEYA